jgi:chemotaxis protein CheD
MEIIVGIGDYAFSDRMADTIKTFALATCIAVTAYSPLKKAAGMVHIALPSPAETESVKRPGYYAATGIPMLIDTMCKKYGCFKSELDIHIYGGANSINNMDIFDIGRRNIEAAANILNNLNIRVRNADIGGTISRTIELEVASGNIRITTQPINI